MFFKKNDKKIEDIFLVKVGALLIHTAKIDENYTENEIYAFLLRDHKLP